VNLQGINYPWLNYGCDFGRNVWRAHSGVTTHADQVRQDFRTMASIGLDVVRWFVFADGRGGVKWNDAGVPGLAPGFFEDMDTALEIALDAGVGLCLVLFDYSWMLRREERDQAGNLLFRTRPDLFSTPMGRRQVIEGLLDPLLERYGVGGEKQALGDAIHSFDVINEPDWVTRGLSPDRSRDAATGLRRLQAGLSRMALRALVGAIADLVHEKSSALVTIGGGRVRFAREWDHPTYGLDFIQVHSYPDVRYPHRDQTLIDRTCASLGVSKPVLIGECPGNADRQHPADHAPPPFSLEDYLTLAREGGYLGAWPWSFKGVDDFGAVDIDSMRRSLQSLQNPQNL
jgi:hypothetical protein